MAQTEGRQVAFWDLGDVQAVVDPLTGEFRKVTGGSEPLPGAPFVFVDGKLRDASSNVDTEADSLLQWRVEGDRVVHKRSGEALSLVEARGIGDGKVLTLDVDKDGKTEQVQIEAYWMTAPTHFSEKEPVNLWLALPDVCRFLFPQHADQVAKRISRCFDTWASALQRCGVDTEHLQKSHRSPLTRSGPDEHHGSQPSGLPLSCIPALAARITIPGLLILLVCFSVSGRFHGNEEQCGLKLAQSLLDGICKHVVAEGAWALTGPELCVPIVDYCVVLDLLLDDQEGTAARSRIHQMNG